MQTFFLWFPPDFFPALLFGLVSGAGFKLWKYAKGSCLLAPVFWYVYGGWLLSCFITLFANAAMLNGFFVGLGLAFIKPLLELFANVYERLAEFRRDRAYWKQEQERKQQEAEQERQDQQRQQEQKDQQQRQREEDARRYQERQHYEQQHQEYQEPPQSKPPPQTHERDTRTSEEVLGLTRGWTQDDLLKAYRRESQRLHPDKWTGKPPVIRQAMEQEFKRVQDAYKRLKR